MRHIGVMMHEGKLLNFFSLCVVTRICLFHRVLLGLTSQTTAENVTQAAYEATGFQIHEVLDAFKRDTPTWNRKSYKERIIFCGDYAENNAFVQFIADIVGCLLERPQTTSPACLGAMICAGITMNVVSLLQAEVMYPPPVEAFSPTTTTNRKIIFHL